MIPFTPRLPDTSIRISERVWLRALEPKDRDAIATILTDPDVARWYPRDEDDFMSVIDEPEVTPYMVLGDDHPIGYVQAYHANAVPFWQSHDVPQETMGLDILLAGADNRDRGLGPQILRILMRRLFGMQGVVQCIIDPDPDNARAIRAYEKLGFRFGPPQVGYEGARMVLGTLSRTEFARTLLSLAAQGS